MTWKEYEELSDFDKYKNVINFKCCKCGNVNTTSNNELCSSCAKEYKKYRYIQKKIGRYRRNK